MDLIQRKISLEDGISRRPDTSYGLMTASTFYVNVMLTQTFDNMGVFTDIGYVTSQPDYTILIDKLNVSGLTFPFMSGEVPPSVVLDDSTHCIRPDNSDVSEWYAVGDTLTGTTEERVNELKSYNKDNRFIAGFDIEAESYDDFEGNSVDGVSRIISTDSEGNHTYTFDTNDDPNIGTTSQTTGILYKSKGDFKSADEKANFYTDIKLSTFQFKTEGWNETNTSLSALTKEEYLMGIISPPEVFNDVFIDRGATTVMEKHLKLSEVESLEHLVNFGNGFYNIVKI